MSIEYKVKPIVVVFRVECPKLDDVVDVDKHCKKCRFFRGIAFDNSAVYCQYESEKI